MEWLFNQLRFVGHDRREDPDLVPDHVDAGHIHVTAEVNLVTAVRWQYVRYKLGIVEKGLWFFKQHQHFTLDYENYKFTFFLS